MLPSKSEIFHWPLARKKEGIAVNMALKHMSNHHSTQSWPIELHLAFYITIAQWEKISLLEIIKTLIPLIKTIIWAMFEEFSLPCTKFKVKINNAKRKLRDKIWNNYNFSGITMHLKPVLCLAHNHRYSINVYLMSQQISLIGMRHMNSLD